MKTHKTKDGKKIKLSELETNHLENIIRWLLRIKSVMPMTNRAIKYLLTMAEKKCSGLNLLQA